MVNYITKKKCLNLTTSASGGEDRVHVPRYTNMIRRIGAIHCNNCLSVNFSLWADFTRYVRETLKFEKKYYSTIIFFLYALSFPNFFKDQVRKLNCVYNTTFNNFLQILDWFSLTSYWFCNWIYYLMSSISCAVCPDIKIYDVRFIVFVHSVGKYQDTLTVLSWSLEEKIISWVLKLQKLSKQSLLDLQYYNYILPPSLHQ